MRWRIVVAVVLAAVACTAAVAVAAPAARRAQAPTLEVRPRAATPGGRVVFYGSGFAPLARVVLLAGPSASATVKIGAARTDADGAFVAPIAIQRDVTPGRYVASACRQRCRVKATAMFRVLTPR
ncbi:hypothetical protein [Conexibacter sp. CPCC 206217]|uniref:hypothetical protein n=1 Tax=Conexibacter sp. CPCC 206217 TaxID=3064574 RepID=UPI0027197E76|nr:hypothetical protein [Conexibacter sp. CPCC 206217]MDO8210723.1 hypothetical protein [Conexibacter sp. CPCC 206217]